MTVFAAYAAHKTVIDEAILVAAIAAASKMGPAGVGAAFCKLQSIAAKKAA
jgi:hypothetical protein